MRRPGYLAGYQAFGKAKGMVAQTPSAPPAEALQTPVQQASTSPTPQITPAQPRPIIGPAPTARRPADPVVVARIEALQARVGAQGRAPAAPARPAARGPAPKPAPRPPARPVVEEDDDED